MQAFHSTSLATYRRPFGAVCEGEQVTLSIAVWDDDVTSCILRLWIEGDGEKNLSMQRVQRPAYTGEVGPQVVDTHSGGFESAASSEVPADAALFSV